MAEVTNLPARKDELSSLPFQIMDLMDDSLIIAELEGRLPSVLTYHFEGKNERGETITIWGLSKSGVDEATAELAKKGEVVREMELIFTDGKDEGFFQVKSGRYAIMKDGREVLLDTKIGAKRQPKKYRNGSENPFWYEQGCMKAARNAAMRLIPASIKQAVIEYAKQEGKVKDISEKDADNPSEEKVAASSKKFAEYHDTIMKDCKTIENFQSWWKENAKPAKAILIPAHYSELLVLKDSLKNKLLKEGKSNE